jgi:hypothetical protein
MSSPSGPVPPSPNGGAFVPPASQPVGGQQQFPTYGHSQQPAYPQQPVAAPQQQPTSWRTLTLDLKQPPWYGWTWLQPTVTIDGYAYSAGWTRLNYQIPADRPVSVQCHVNYMWAYGKASAVLEPWHAPHLEYTAPANAWFDGDLGAPGTTTAKGKGMAIGILVVLGGIVLLSLALSIGALMLASLSGGS